MTGAGLGRLLAPRHIAVVGGDAAATAIRQSRRLGYEGEIWPVNERRSRIEGLRCFTDIGSLPEAPDAALVAVHRESATAVIGDLAKHGAGGAVCHAAGFAESGAYGAELQQSLVDSAAGMPVIGPNCIGVVNYLDGAALWPDEHGGERVDRGVAVITQSGNVAQNLSMQRRSLPIGVLATAGNAAVTGVADLVDALVRDARVTAIGLHLEGVPDIEELSSAAALAHERCVPIVVLKSGTSELGARANASHTSSLAGPDVLVDALFARLGFGRVREVDTFIETLKLLHVHGTPAGGRIVSASCSGGEAAFVADRAEAEGLQLPSFDAATGSRLADVLGDRVPIANPLDYQTHIWGDPSVQESCFRALVNADADVHLLVLDRPRGDRCAAEQWDRTVDAYVAATGGSCTAPAVLSLLPEGIPEPLGRRLRDSGVAPLQGLETGMRAIAVAASIGRAHRRTHLHVPTPSMRADGSGHRIDEYAGKRILARIGVPTPRGELASAADARAVADRIGYPVVAKVAAGLAHKSDVGGVRLGLTDPESLREAVDDLRGLGERFLIERLVDDAVAELIVGVRRDPSIGTALTIGSGGVLVELMGDSITLLAPVGEEEVAGALRSLRGWPLLDGFRGRPAADVDAAVRAIATVARHVHADESITELEINPLLVCPAGRGVVAADVHGRINRDGEPRTESKTHE